MSIQTPSGSSLRSEAPASKPGDDNFSSSGNEPLPFNVGNGAHSTEKRISTEWTSTDSIPVRAPLFSEKERAKFCELHGDEFLNILDSIGIAWDWKSPEAITVMKNITNRDLHHRNSILVIKELLLKNQAFEKRSKLRDEQSTPLQDCAQGLQKSLSKPGASTDQISTLGEEQCNGIDGINNEISALHSVQQTKEDSDRCIKNPHYQVENIERKQELEDKVTQLTVSQLEKTLKDHEVWQEKMNSQITKLETEFSDFASRERNLSRCLPNALSGYADSVKNQICDIVLSMVKEFETGQENIERSLQQLEV
jgi:hypothetical protein